MALSNDRDTKSRGGDLFGGDVKGGVVLYVGALACLDATGFIVPGAANPALIALGRSSGHEDNSAGADGDIGARIERGIFLYDNSAGGDEIALSDINQLCFVVDDGTVAKTDGGGTRCVAGRIYDVGDGGVWVDFRIGVAPAKAYVTLQATDLVAGDAAVYRAPAPIGGRVTKVLSVLEGHIVVAGDATLTGKIGAAAITGGVITHALAGTALGEVKTATPTAANACNAGDVISFTVGGANTNNAATARLVVEITS